MLARHHDCNQDALFEATFVRLTEGDDYREKNPNRPYAKDGRWFSPEGRTKAAGLGSAGVGQEPGGAAGFSKSAVLFSSSLWTLSAGWRIY